MLGGVKAVVLRPMKEKPQRGREPQVLVEGPVDLAFNRVSRTVKLYGFYFDGPLNAEGATFAHDFEVRDSVFAQLVDISDAQVHGILDLRRGSFAHSLDMSRTRVESKLNLQGDETGQYETFLGGVDASDMVISGGVNANFGCYFHLVNDAGYDASVSWESTVIGGTAQLNSYYATPADFSNLTVKGPLYFEKAYVTPYPRTEPCGFRTPAECAAVNFSGMRVDGPASFHDTTTQGCLSFQNATFESLDLAMVAQPAQGRSSCQSPDSMGSPNLNGLWYSRVLGGATTIRRMAALMGTLPRGDMNVPVTVADARDSAETAFGHLEIVAKAQGHRDVGDEVYVLGQRWQQKSLTTPFSKLLSKLDDGYIGYGRAPLHALAFCLLLLGLFWTVASGLQAAGSLAPGFNVFTFGLTCFLPETWHEKWGTPALPSIRWSVGRATVDPIVVGITVYMIASGMAFLWLIFHLSGDSWPATIAIAAGALFPLCQRISDFTLRSRKTGAYTHSVRPNRAGGYSDHGGHRNL